MTTLQLTKLLVRVLGNAPHATSDARILVAHALDCSKETLIADPTLKVSKQQQRRAVHLAQRRASQEPLAYILGYRDFFGRRFLVNRHVLIPRPETEHLIEEVLRLSTMNHLPSTLFLDIGTGSGAVALTLAAETGTPTLATDVSRRALRVAKKNARRLHVDHLVECKHGHLLDPIKASYLYGFTSVVITANLPYLTSELLQDSPKEVTQYEPELALISDTHDGLNLYRELLGQLLVRHEEFPKNTTLLLEIDPRQGDLVAPMIHELFPDATVTIKPDLAGHPRLVTIKLG